jgi:hypothetical protein
VDNFGTFIFGIITNVLFLLFLATGYTGFWFYVLAAFICAGFLISAFTSLFLHRLLFTPSIMLSIIYFALVFSAFQFASCLIVFCGCVVPFWMLITLAVLTVISAILGL